MLSIQEMLDKTAEQRKLLETHLDENSYFDPNEISIFNGQKKSVSREIYETLKRVSLAEFLSKANTAAGANYLVPDFVSAKIYSSLQTADIVPLISSEIISTKSDTLTVNVGLMSAQVAKTGLGKPTSTGDFVKASIGLERISANIAITNEMLEDQEYGLMEWHLSEAAKALASRGNNAALTILRTMPDGRGTNIALSAGSDTTTPAQVGQAIGTVGIGAQSATWPGFVADTMVVTQEAWGDAIATTAGHPVCPPQKPGYDAWFAGLNVIFCNDPALNGGYTSNRAINCITPIFSKEYALLTARKNWGRIENYSDPVKDLSGAVISGRQDSVTMNKDAIVALTET